MEKSRTSSLEVDAGKLEQLATLYESQGLFVVATLIGAAAIEMHNVLAKTDLWERRNRNVVRRTNA